MPVNLNKWPLKRCVIPSDCSGVMMYKYMCRPEDKTVSPFHANQGEGHTGAGEEIQGGVPSPMQLWRDLHWVDTEEARDKNEGALRCLSEGDTGEVSPCRTCVGEPPSNQMGGGNGD